MAHAPQPPSPVTPAPRASVSARQLLPAIVVGTFLPPLLLVLVSLGATLVRRGWQSPDDALGGSFLVMVVGVAVAGPVVIIAGLRRTSLRVAQVGHARWSPSLPEG